MPALYVLLAGILWGMLTPISRYALQAGLTPLETALWRAGIASACFLMHATLVSGARARARLRLRDVPAIFGFGLLGVSLLEGSILLSVEKGGAALASILLYSAPIWVALFSRLLFREAMPARKLAALAIAISGVVGVALNGSSLAPGGLQRFSGVAAFWGILSGLSYASYYLFGKAYLGRYSAVTLFAYAFPIGTLGLLPFVEFHPKTPSTWGVLVFLGIACTYLAYLSYYAGLRRLEPTRASILASIEPIVSTVLAFGLWGERLGAWGCFFAAWVILGIALMVTGGTPSSSGSLAARSTPVEAASSTESPSGRPHEARG
jgi:drug/metabolite transporter, DME family